MNLINYKKSPVLASLMIASLTVICGTGNLAFAGNSGESLVQQPPPPYSAVATTSVSSENAELGAKLPAEVANHLERLKYAVESIYAIETNQAVVDARAGTRTVAVKFNGSQKDKLQNVDDFVRSNLRARGIPLPPSRDELTISFNADKTQNFRRTLRTFWGEHETAYIGRVSVTRSAKIGNEETKEGSVEEIKQSLLKSIGTIQTVKQAELLLRRLQEYHQASSKIPLAYFSPSLVREHRVTQDEQYKQNDTYWSSGLRDVAGVTQTYRYLVKGDITSHGAKRDDDEENRDYPILKEARKNVQYQTLSQVIERVESEAQKRLEYLKLEKMIIVVNNVRNIQRFTDHDRMAVTIRHGQLREFTGTNEKELAGLNTIQVTGVYEKKVSALARRFEQENQGYRLLGAAADSAL